MIDRIEVINGERIILHAHMNVYIRHYYNPPFLLTICSKNNGIMVRYLTIFSDSINHFTI